jgi:threonine/homoserine/homoserine lactone efflux protein
METFIGLVAFAFLSSGSPGPNNVLLWASGATFGLRATIPHVVGTAVGLGMMALAAAAGLAAIVAGFPPIEVAMKVAGSAYLLWLAWRTGRRSMVQAGTTARPLSVLQAAAFQVVNPKAWIFALGAVTTFRPSELGPLAGTVVVAVTMIAVVLVTATAWGVAGGSLSRLMAGERGRIAGPVMGVLVAATVVLAWL